MYMGTIEGEDREHVRETTEELRYILKDATTGECPDCGYKKVGTFGYQELFEIFCECRNEKCRFQWAVLADDDPWYRDDAITCTKGEERKGV